MRNSIINSITNTVHDLNRSGIVDDITMKNIDRLCISAGASKKLLGIIERKGLEALG